MNKLSILFILSCSMMACAPSLARPVNTASDSSAPILVTEKSEKCVTEIKGEFSDNIDRIKDKGKDLFDRKQKEAEDYLKDKKDQTKDWLKQKIDSL